MDKESYKELLESFEKFKKSGAAEGKDIYLFGHCNSTETMADFFLDNGFLVAGILDNNYNKYGLDYRGIPICPPAKIMEGDPENAIVCIAIRFYETMNEQLRELGFQGPIVKMVDFNTFAEYSLFNDTIRRKTDRLRHGQEIIRMLDKERGEPRKDNFYVFCPLPALGDVYFTCSYLPYFLKKRNIDETRVVISTSSIGCEKVVRLFGQYRTAVLKQKDLEAAMQAAIYSDEDRFFIAHQDRPYVVDLQRALYAKKIPLETIYKCGIFGLPQETKPVKPVNWKEYPRLDEIEDGRAVILSPYAKSVTALPEKIWKDIIYDYKDRGFRIFTNISGEEKPLPDTMPISPDISEMKSVVERAGTFIGLRSGICDVIKTADYRKVALFPDYYYMDTKWKAIDMYSIDGFENIFVKDDFVWKS